MSGRASRRAILVVASTCGVVVLATLVAGLLAVGLVAAVILGASLLLRTRVTFAPDAVNVHMVPLFHRRIPADAVASVRPRTVAPLREFGGWGVRKKRDATALLLGSRTVEIELNDGYRYVVSVSEEDCERLNTLTLP
ncbi:MAG: hypothetical protein M3N11_05455 [Actinomycetota bacterium]|nr:hypothetical protein [Actinomycetota bacterium]